MNTSQKLLKKSISSSYHQLQMYNKNSLEYLSQQIQINPLDIESIEMRSQLLTVQGKYDQAISDFTKLIHLDMSRQHYVKRSQLFNHNRQYVDALRDLSTASQMQKEDDEETGLDVYFQNSVCMKNIKQVEQFAELLEREKESQNMHNQQKIIKQLLVVQSIQSKQIKEYRQEIQQLKKFYQEQTNKLQLVLKQHLGEIKTKQSQFYLNYQYKFQKELDSSNLPNQHKGKLKLYFRSFASEMQKYYIAAKNLNKIEDKTVKFEDFENMIFNKKNTNILNILYKLFDKYGSQVQKLQQILDHIPYIGTTFRIVKTAMKANGWKEQIKIENQCKNIEELAINTTSFNDFSTNLGYYIVKYYEKQIIQQKNSYKSSWELLLKKIKQMKLNQIGNFQYKHLLTPQEQIVRDYAIIHASILMIGYACRQISFKPENIKNINKIYQNDHKQAFQQINEVFLIINKVQSILKEKISKQSTYQAVSTGSSCIIY